MSDAPPQERIGIGGFLYGTYVWLEFSLCLLASILAALSLPGVERRRRAVAFCGRLSLRLAAIETIVAGTQNLPATDCIVVANHASYIDAVVLQGFLPARFSFVVKGEMRNVPLLGRMLQRVGSRFVERFEASGSARDARRLLKAARAGESLAIFPEGTFVATPGLGRFRAGAFAAAIRAEIPVVPAVISGSRQILSAEKWLPRHGDIRVDFLAPIEPLHTAFSSSKELAALARSRILEVLDEPDRPAASAGQPD